MIDPRDERANANRAAISSAEARKSVYYAACPSQVSFNERSYKLTTLAIKRLGRLGKKERY